MKLHWRGAASEGDKLLCLDDLFHDIIDGKCLVYSFGIAQDWTFEISMADIGCKVSSMKQLQCASISFNNIIYIFIYLYLYLHIFICRYMHLIQQSMSLKAASYLTPSKRIYFFINGQCIVLQEMILRLATAMMYRV